VWSTISVGLMVAILEGHTGSVRSVCSVVVEDRILLASGSEDETVRLWHPGTAEAVAILEGHTGSVLSMEPRHWPRWHHACPARCCPSRRSLAARTRRQKP
jgi:WD40 repeat protein